MLFDIYLKIFVLILVYLAMISIFFLQYNTCLPLLFLELQIKKKWTNK